ncbi:MAG TPA: hypothetical protein VIG50_08810 [Vicinamibacteria bacterium]|jgi:cytosine/uracil/thiamine/allantoin permease
MATERRPGAGERRPADPGLNRRLEEIAWGVFLIMIGVLWLLPAGTLPEDTWLVGAGAIILGLNLARYVRGLAVSAFTTVLGATAVGGGAAAMYGVDVPVLAILPIFIGAQIIVRPLIRRLSPQH